MTDFPYEPVLLIDPVTLQRAANAQTTVYDALDTANTTPLALKDGTGLPLANPLTSSADAFTRPFYAPSQDIKLVGAGLTVFVSSAKGMRDAAAASAEAAQAAADSAATAAGNTLSTASVDGSGQLVVTKASGAQVNAGNVKGPKGDKGDTGAKGADGSNVLPTDDAIKQAINDTASATRGALNATYAQAWKASTAYTPGQPVVSPTGDVVTAKTAFTSGSTYDATKWNLSSSYAAKSIEPRTSGKKAVAQDELIVNVKDYGAVGDGTTDDTAAIQAAINAANVQVTSSGAGAGRPVFIPAGRYKITDTLLIPSGVSIQGASGGVWSTSKGESRLFMPTGINKTLMANADQVNGDASIEIRNLKVMAAGGNAMEFKALGAAGIDGKTCRRILIVDCFIQNSAGNGIVFSDVQVSIIRGCYIAGNTGHSIWFMSSYDNEITGCQIDTYQSATDSFGGDGIRFASGGASGGMSDYNIIHGNFVFLCENGVNLANARGNVVSANRINTCNVGVRMQTFGGGTNVERNLVTGNVFYDHGYKNGNGLGVLVDGTVQYNTVAANQFSRDSGAIFNYAVQVGSTAIGNVITGNTARNLVQGKSFTNTSTQQNVFTNNTVVERGQRNSTVLTSAGAVAFDASLGDAQVATLQANATSSTLINGHQGQRVTISWLQDATGGRTYVWPTNCRFAGGTAPNDTTANKQTSATFVYSGTLWMETGRSVAVG